jgi:hypothetical protein
MLEWWQSAYIDFEDSALRDRFVNEATIALPVRAVADEAVPEQVFDAMMFKRAALKQDLQLSDWEFGVR